MERLTIKVMLMGMVVMSSCYYDVAEELYPPTTCVTDNMSLQSNIVPILERNCYVCHSVTDGPNNGNVILEGYTQLIKYVDNGQLVGAINHESGFSFMPKNAAKLGDCDISKIEHWVLDGAPNN
ncbi:MAG: hypothetical protein IPN60_11600 [Saprospiraceae bacterium]|jgi:hypothetical protein|nr:hypothetical protein [Candidatus Opimibacter skivensis]MBL0006685.1 hypothetical protein [Candidatus Opimibacter skivensis]